MIHIIELLLKAGSGLVGCVRVCDVNMCAYVCIRAGVSEDV